MPAGGVTSDGCWLPARKDYLVPVKALSDVFRGVFLQLARKALPQHKFPNVVWTKRWWIDCRPTVHGTERILQYLARYVHRVAFSNSRLIRISDREVTFRYRRCAERQWRTMTLSPFEFMRRFLQHVLPRGTHKVRYYGIWNPVHRQLLRRVQLVTGASQITNPDHDDGKPEGDVTENEPFEHQRTCPHCGQGRLVLSETIPRRPRHPP